MKRPNVPAGGAGRHSAPMETEVLRDHMPLIEHMATTQYDDGSPRQPGWVTIQTYGRTWTVSVKDPDTCLSFRCIGESLDEALEMAALLLGAEEAPWEPDPWLRRAATERKKK